MRNRTWLLALGAVATLVVSACGSDSKNSASGLEGEHIMIGLICSCSSSFGNTISVGRDVAQAWADSVNEDGGIDGHPVELVVKDDAGDPGKSVSAAQALITAKVSVIMDLSPLNKTWADIVTDAKIPVVGGNLSSELYYTNSNFYPSGQTNDSILYSTAYVAQQAGVKKLAQVYCAEAPTCEENVKNVQDAAKDLGLANVYTASISATAPNYTAQCVAAQQAGADGLFIAHSAPTAAKVAANCDQQGFDPIFVTQGTGYGSDLGEAAGAKDNLWMPFPSLPFFADDQKPVKEFRDVIEKAMPGALDKSTFSQFAAEAWTAGLLIGKAVDATGLKGDKAVASTDITDGLNSLKDETLDGWSPPLTFEKGKNHSVNCWFTARVQGGKPSLVDAKPTCKDA